MRTKLRSSLVIAATLSVGAAVGLPATANAATGFQLDSSLEKSVIKAAEAPKTPGAQATAPDKLASATLAWDQTDITATFTMKSPIDPVNDADFKAGKNALAIVIYNNYFTESDTESVMVVAKDDSTGNVVAKGMGHIGDDCPVTMNVSGSTIALKGSSPCFGTPGTTSFTALYGDFASVVDHGDATGLDYYPAAGRSAWVTKGGGYWMAAKDGGIFSFGNAPFFGSMGGKPLNKPIVGMSPMPDAKGYRMVATDGGIFDFGSAEFFGSMGGKPLNKPMVGMATTKSGKGYWTVAADGGVFCFGDAGFFGSMGGKPLNKPVIGMIPSSTGQGYILVASDGGVFTFGDAKFYGSTGKTGHPAPIVGISGYGTETGYYMVDAKGGILEYGAAPKLAGLNHDFDVFGVQATAVSSADGGLRVVDTDGRIWDRGALYHHGDFDDYTVAPNAYPSAVAEVPVP